MPRRPLKPKPDLRARKTGGGFWSWPAVAVFGLALALSAGGYLAKVSAASAKGAEIRALENEVADLKEAHDRLELKVAQEQSVRAVERKVQELGMVPTPKMEYVIATAPVVARR